jgi:cell wall assembly regulator SMI1
MTESTSPRSLSTELLERLDQRLIEIGAPIAKAWRPGLTDADMDALVSELGLSLSAEIRLWWGWHDGIEGPSLLPTVGGGWAPISLHDAVQDTIQQREKAALWRQEFPGNPIGDWADSWITFCATPSPARLASDCGAPDGSLTPVLYFDPEFNEDPRQPKAVSMGELVHIWLGALDDGTWHIDPATGDFALLDPTELVEAKGRDVADLL